MRFEKQQFSGIEVIIDYNEFIDCVIANCVVVSYGGPYKFERTTLDNPAFQLRGAALGTLEVLRMIRATQAPGRDLVKELVDSVGTPPPKAN
jgi:hypothetical protein